MKEDWLCIERNWNGGVRKTSPFGDQIKEKEFKGLIKVRKGKMIRKGKNLVLDLVERISKEFNISNCWICGDTGLSEIWPWEGTGLSPQEVLKWEKTRQR